MNKRITSLALVFVLVLSMLTTAMPAWAVPIESTQLKVVPDTTTASPGDIINYTVIVGPVSDMGTMQMQLEIPEGLTYVPNSGKLTDGLRETLGFDTADWTEVSLMINGVASAADYESSTDTELAKFQCTVNDGYTGTVEVGLWNLEFGSVITWEYHTDRFSVVKTPVTVTAASKPATGITVTPDTLNLTVGQSQTLTADVEPDDTTDTVTWESNAIGIATINATTGEVTAVAPGTATITAKAGDKTDTCTVTVEAAPCTHSNKTTIPEKASDCTNQGWDAYQTCDDCGTLFDMSGDPIAEIPYRELDPNAHTFGSWVDGVPANCTDTGTKGYKDCTLCGKHFDNAGAEITDLTIPTNDIHDFNMSEWGYKGSDGHAHICNNNPLHHDTPVAHNFGTDDICDICGYEREHVCVYDKEVATDTYLKFAADCTSPAVYYKSCACGEKGTETFTFGDPLGHDWKDATCTEPKTCDRCGETEGVALGHDYGEPVWNWEDDGSSATATFTCGNDPTHTEFLTDNAPTSAVTTPATCEGMGTTTYTAKVTFDGETYTGTKAVQDIAATDHSYSEPVWNWAVDGKTCSVTFTCGNAGCGHTEILTGIITFAEKISATCEGMGTTTYTAKVTFDGETYTDDKDVQDIEPLGHKPEADDGDCTTPIRCSVCDEIVTPGNVSHTGGTATCTELATCEVCGKEYGELLSHTWSADYLLDHADAEKHYHVCEVCGTKDQGEEHNPGLAATEETAQTCTVCGYVITPPTGHIHANHLTLVNGVEPTCTTDGSKAYYECSCDLYFEDSQANTQITQNINEWKKIDALGHTPEEDDGDCTTAVLCSVCKEVVIPARASHIWSEDYLAENADDEMHYHVCQYCGTKDAGEVHTDPILIGAEEATCTAEGYTGDQVCEVCGKVLVQGTTIAKVPHNYVNGVCSVCGARESTGTYFPPFSSGGTAEDDEADSDGWQKDESGKLHYYQDGEAVTGWLQEKGTWYYLDTTGAMETGWQFVDNTWYYLKDDGAMQTGWLRDNDKWYYLKDWGGMAEGWVKDKGTWYYLEPASGKMATGWKLLDGIWYYLKDWGGMAEGWVKDKGTWYYLEPASGKMKTSWQLVGGLWYYFYDWGGMATNTTIDGYYVNASGAWVR